MENAPLTQLPLREKTARPDVHRTGPGTIAGDYMRRFWQPVFQGGDIPAGRAKPVKIMNVDYTIYRGEDGRPHLTQARCPHRGMQLSVGWVEKDAIRCFYHGWKFGETGACVAQPAEPQLSATLHIRTYPVREYLGLIFAYLGEGDAPEFPTYPAFENFEGVLELDGYIRGCNYFNNLENGADIVHSGFVHRNNPGSFDGFTNSPQMEASESCWGMTVYAKWPEQELVSQIGMPNIFHHKAQPTDLAIAPYREFMAWWVPIDDESHVQFTVAAVRLPPEQARQYLERRKAKVEKRTTTRAELAEQVLRGEIWLDQIDPETTDLVRLQDDIAQAGQGRIADHHDERLGRSDKAIVILRRIWARELVALGQGEPLTDWKYDAAALDISRGKLWETQYAAVHGQDTAGADRPRSEPTFLYGRLER